MKEEIDSERFTKYGWDRQSFFYPTKDTNGLILASFIILLVLHFDEIFGISESQEFIFGFLPVHFTYHLIYGFFALLFTYWIYKSWPQAARTEEVNDSGE